MSLTVRYVPPRVDARVKLAAAKTAIETAGAEVLLEAAVPNVPVDSEQLRDSGHLDHSGVGVAVVFQAVSDDGYPYDIRQHEDMSLHHPNGGGPKYLEKPMHTEGASIAAAMVAMARART